MATVCIVAGTIATNRIRARGLGRTTVGVRAAWGNRTPDLFITGQPFGASTPHYPLRLRPRSRRRPKPAPAVAPTTQQTAPRRADSTSVGRDQGRHRRAGGRPRRRAARRRGTGHRPDTAGSPRHHEHGHQRRPAGQVVARSFRYEHFQTQPTRHGSGGSPSVGKGRPSSPPPIRCRPFAIRSGSGQIHAERR